MSSADMQRAIEAFSRAHGMRDPAEREAYLVQLGRESAWLREEVESLLAAKTGPDGPGGGESSGREDLAARVYPQIPNCRITAEIGRGGFGTVYRALRESAELAPVAIKVLQAGKDAKGIIERFKRERHLHARTDSPYVARVIDVGTTSDGEPYLMMELVEGARTFMHFAEQQKLTIEQRLELFKKICAGIEHLHVNGIYHRDLKPSNILVSVVDGSADPKIIDFGLAKTDDELALTQDGARIGTRGYMSPEQEAGKALDLRTDIYSLGVLLHELLTGTRPELARSTDESQRLPSSRISSLTEPGSVLAERRLRNLRQLTKTLRGDLDAIIVKCLQHDRSERYQSPGELRSDIIRHEHREPVLARGKGGLYALARLADRHRVTALSVCAGVLALIVGVSVASIALADERQANANLSTAKLATEEALLREERTSAALLASNEELTQIRSFEQDRIRSIDPAEMESFLREEVLRQARRGLETLPVQESAVRFTAFEETLARTNFTTVALEALKHSVFQDAEASINSNFEGLPLARATLLHEQSTQLVAVGLTNMALRPMLSALEIRLELLGADDPLTLESMQSVGVLRRKRAEYEQARALLHQAVAGIRSAYGELDARTLQARLELACVSMAELDGSLALKELEELRPVFLQTLGPEHQETLRLEMAIDSVKGLAGKDSEVVATSRAIYEQLVQSQGPKDVRTLQAMYNLSLVMHENGQTEEASVFAKQAYEGLSELKGLDHTLTLSAANSYCRVLVTEGRFREATVILRASLAERIRTNGLGSVETVLVQANLAQVLRKSNDITEALVFAEQAIDGARQLFKYDSSMLGNLVVDYGRTLHEAGEMEDAEAALLEGYAILDKALGEEHSETCTAADALSMFYAGWNEIDPSTGYDIDQEEWIERTHGFVVQESEAELEAIRAHRDSKLEAGADD